GSTVTFHRYPSNNCTGTPVDQTGVVVPSGVQTAQVDSATFTTTPGSFSYLVDFISGNTTVLFNRSGDRATTDCEPFTVIASATISNGTDELGNPATADGESERGSVRGMTMSTSLALKSAPTAVKTGDPVTIVVTETNTGSGTLTNVNVTGGGACSSFSPASVIFASNASQDFTCKFTAAAGANAWSALGNGTYEYGNAAPADGESLTTRLPADLVSTTLALKSAPTAVKTGDPVTIVVTETNTGNGTLTNVNVTG